MLELEALAGSVICAGFPGAAPDAAVLAEIRELRLGALVLFARNVSEVAGTRALVAAVRDAAGGDAPALVCIDQEGGRVARLRFGGELPSMLTLGAADDEAFAERAGARIANEVRAVGANVAFAPVLDLALEPMGTAIGTRSLGDDPERVARLGAALVRGMQRAGAGATVKHFPGHGATALDSHVALPVVAASKATLRAREFAPFRAAFGAGASAVMSAHVVARALDPRAPATLSRAVLTGALRERLGFSGVCFTDCLQMDAIARGVGTARGAALALAAGADCALVSHDLALARDVRDSIVEAVRSGTLAYDRLAEASGRVLALRRRFPPDAAVTPPPYPSDDGLAHEIASAAIVVVRGSPALVAERPVTVVSFETATGDGIASSQAERPSLSLALRRRRLRSELLRVAATPDDAMCEMLVDLIRAQGVRNVVVVARRAHLSEPQRRAIDAILDVAPQAIVVSALEPFDVPSLSRARTLLCSFGDDEANIEAVADVLTGGHPARGNMPVSLQAAPA